MTWIAIGAACIAGIGFVTWLVLRSDKHGRTSERIKEIEAREIKQLNEISRDKEISSTARNNIAALRQWWLSKKTR